MDESYTMMWTDCNGMLRSHTEHNVESKEHALSHAISRCPINMIIIDYIGDFENMFNVDFFLWTVNGRIR